MFANMSQRTSTSLSRYWVDSLLRFQPSSKIDRHRLFHPLANLIHIRTTTESHLSAIIYINTSATFHLSTIIHMKNSATFHTLGQFDSCWTKMLSQLLNNEGKSWAYGYIYIFFLNYYDYSQPNFDGAESSGLWRGIQSIIWRYKSCFSLYNFVH